MSTYIICDIQTFCLFGGKWYFSLQDIKMKIIGLYRFEKTILSFSKIMVDSGDGRCIETINLKDFIKLIKKTKKYCPNDILKYFKIKK